MYDDFVNNFISQEAHKSKLNEIMPLGLIEPSDVAKSVLFLLSSQSSKITAECIKISSGGGVMMKFRWKIA